MTLAEGECGWNDDNVAAELIVFDDDGHEGFYERKYFTSSYAAAKYFLKEFSEAFHLKITQVHKDDGR
mgnify:CR=1 FL=1